ncbi:DUF4282 domain-containing protein [Leptolyngbya sp. 15MV]|nr:DUF4282 domain-containing protein [Leptolyngbya sp. 15MV]
MNHGFAIRDLLDFEKLIALKVLKIVYYLGLIGITLFALVSLAGAFGMMSYDITLGLGTMLMVVIGFALGVLFWRILIELYMTFFGIYERLGEVRDRLGKPE